LKHHSSYKTADWASVLFKRIFRDSEIACRISSPQMKIEAILFKNDTVYYCGDVKDTSSHNAVKVFPGVIQ
jgi:hypothetical protein